MDNLLLKITGAAAVIAASECRAENLRPNILWLTFEDTSAEFIGCYGNELAKTPNIDRLASDGVRFNSAFSTAAVSSASRFCLITGVKAFSAGNGSHRSAYKIPDTWNGFPYYLRLAGYYTSNNKKTDYNVADEEIFTKKAWNECSDKADWRKRRPGQPFFAVYNSMSSHQSRTMTDTWDSYKNLVLSKLDESERTDWGNLDMPPFYRNSPAMQKNLSRVYNSITKTDKEFGEWLDKLEADGLRDSTIIFCFSDHGEGIPRGKCSPLSNGYRVPFILWIPPMYEHLSPFGSGIVTDELISFEDLAPTVLALAGVEIPEYIEGKPFLGKSPCRRRKYVFSGLDRTDENTDLSRSVSDGTYIYTRCFMPYQPLVRWMEYWDSGDIQKEMRKDFEENRLSKLQSSIMETREEEYLFNIREDKWETVNLAGNKRYAGILNRMRKVLREHIIESRDAGFIPEHIIKKNMKIPPYILRLDDGLFPVKRIVNNIFPVEDKNREERIIAGLRSDNAIEQYWSAVTIFSSREMSCKYADILDSMAGAIRYPIAKMHIIAALAFNCGDRNRFREFLSYIGSPDKELERMTLQILANMDSEHIRESLPAVTTRLESPKIPYQTRQWCNIIRCKLGLFEFEGTISNF